MLLQSLTGYVLDDRIIANCERSVELAVEFTSYNVAFVEVKSLATTFVGEDVFRCTEFIDIDEAVEEGLVHELERIL